MTAPQLLVNCCGRKYTIGDCSLLAIFVSLLKDLPSLLLLIAHQLIRLPNAKYALSVGVWSNKCCVPSYLAALVPKDMFVVFVLLALRMLLYCKYIYRPDQPCASSYAF